MSVQLLDKTRKINKLLHNNNSSKVVFNDICSVLSDILESNVLVISKKGKVLGISQYHGVDEIHELIVDRVGGLIDPLLNERLLGILSTKENVNLQTLGFEFENIRKYQALVAPIDIAGERLDAETATGVLDQNYGGTLDMVFDEDGNATMEQGGGNLTGTYEYVDEYTLLVSLDNSGSTLNYACAFAEDEDGVTMVLMNDDTGYNGIYFMQ